ncbi:phosphatase PAP2 family protein [Luteolibacter pohnpeiensis]|uniref:phosphatase PAP2 family protein n=1 Tax=Luteolibacter pohnpeiensis TaxID=454153 RepID=UPI0019070327|nr:phosphatase PAP2 family protein [Luteolibacter pohnpeiensis]
MSRSAKCLALATAMLTFSGVSFAAEPIVLPPGVDFSILPPPPADDSPAGMADLSVLLYVQRDRTPEQEKLAKEMASPSVFAMGREIFGPWFTRENLPKTAAILREVSQVTDKVKNDAKNEWKRPRPYVRSSLVHPVVGKPGDAGCYPSGHSYGIAIPEFVLTAAFPEHAEQFDEMIHRVMWGRVIGGVHYPSDTEAGRLLAKDVIDKLLQTDPMKEAIKTIQEEAAPFLKKDQENQKSKAGE